MGLTAAQTQLREAAQRDRDKEHQHTLAIEALNQNKAKEVRNLVLEIDKHRNESMLTKMSLNASEEALVASEEERVTQEQRLRQLAKENAQLLARTSLLEIAQQENQTLLKNMGLNFTLAREKLACVNTHVQALEQEQAQLVDKLRARIAVVEKIFKEEVALRQAAEFALSEARKSDDAVLAELLAYRTELAEKEQETGVLREQVEVAQAEMKARMEKSVAGESELRSQRNGNCWWRMSALMALGANRGEAGEGGARSVETQTEAGGVGGEGGKLRRVPLEDWFGHFRAVVRQAQELTPEEMDKVRK